MDSAAYARRQVTIRKSDPELCKNCGAPELCLAFRTADEYVSPDGKLRQIVGCNTEEYIFGNILTDADIKQIGVALTEEHEQGGSSGCK